MPLLFNPNDAPTQRIIQKCATLHETYSPPWWCFNHVINVIVTLMKGLFGSSLKFKRDVIVCPDGGKLACRSYLNSLLFSKFMF